MSVSSIRAYAKKIVKITFIIFNKKNKVSILLKDLEDTLKTYLNDGNTEINTQIQFIINQINSNQESSINESENENEDNDDDDEVNY